MVIANRTRFFPMISCPHESSVDVEVNTKHPEKKINYWPAQQSHSRIIIVRNQLWRVSFTELTDKTMKNYSSLTLLLWIREYFCARHPPASRHVVSSNDSSIFQYFDWRDTTDEWASVRGSNECPQTLPWLMIQRVEVSASLVNYHHRLSVRCSQQ